MGPTELESVTLYRVKSAFCIDARDRATRCSTIEAMAYRRRSMISRAPLSGTLGRRYFCLRIFSPKGRNARNATGMPWMTPDFLKNLRSKNELRNRAGINR